jgi:hypothetical protein
VAAGKNLPRGGLDGGDVGIDQDRLDSSFLEGLESLTSGIIELSGLTNGGSSVSEDQDLAHARRIGTGERWDIKGHVRGVRLELANLVDELSEQVGGIHGSAAGFGVELDGEERLGSVDDT